MRMGIILNMPLPQMLKMMMTARAMRARGQQVYIVTERAVFKLGEQGVMLIEIAPGIDLQTQVLDLMDFKPIISGDLKIMDGNLYNDGPVGIKRTF